MCFSKNVPMTLATQISTEGNIPITNDMGIYLGVPTLCTRVSKDTFQHLLDKIKAKLIGWKARPLSFAGYITFAKHVLNVASFYTMQTSKIPVLLLDEIDRVVRCFV